MKKMLLTEQALIALNRFAADTTLPDNEAFECYRAIKKLINECDDIRRCLDRNDISELCKLEHSLYELKVLKNNKE